MMDEMDEIWMLYADDGAQSLDAMEAALDALEGGKGDMGAHIGALFRAVHTFKGNSRVLGLAQVEGLAHLAEDLIGLVRDEGVPLNGEITDILMRTGDALRGMLEETADTRADVEPGPTAGLKQDLRTMIGRLTGAEAEPAEPAPAAEPQPDVAPQKAAAEAPAAPKSEPEPEPEAASAPKAKAPVFDMGLAGLLDQLDGGDGAEFDEFEGDDDEPEFEPEDDPEPEAELEAEEDAAPQSEAEAEPEPEPEPAPQVKTVAEVTEGKLLAPDSEHHKIFNDMADKTCAALDALVAEWVEDTSPRAAHRQADNLHYAAGQLNLADWLALLEPVLSGDAPDLAATRDLSAAIRRLLSGESAAPEVAEEPAPEPEPMPEPAVDVVSEPVAEPEPAPEPQVEAKAAPVKKTTALPKPAVEVAEGKLRADQTYHQIFADMVFKTLDKMDALCANWSEDSSLAALRKEADGLRYAAQQLDLTGWVALLDPVAEATGMSHAAAKDHVAELRARAAQEFGDADAAPAQTRGPIDPAADGRAFFQAIAELYPLIADQGMRMGGDTPCTMEERRDLAERIADLAAPREYVRLVDSAHRLSQEPAGHAYRAAELALYEELVSVERSLPASVFDAEMMPPSKLLGAWCVDHIFETLQSLRKGMEARSVEDGANWFPAFSTLMRQVHFACLNYRIETASQLTMALIDLFARVRVDQKAPDVILLQMGRGFVDTMELVFDALDQGDTPDTSRIEKMFEEATNACFVASGVMTAKSIESRLGLPPEFHRVMSPESVKTAHEAIKEGLHFYVLRADLNDDDALAQGFLEWITTGVVRMITNVTVFLDKATLFDFLVASSLEEDRMVERLAMLDTTGTRLMMAQALKVREAPEAGAAEPDTLDLIPMSDVGDSLALLEAVGAISASHAQLEHELTQLASVDLVQDVMEALRAAGVGELEQRVRSVLRDRLEQHNMRLQEISESGAQLSAELSHLQQESVAQRSRPSEVLLRPLKAYVATQARKIGVDASVTYVGGDVMLDQMLIEELRGPLKTLVNLRLSGEYPASRFHISVEAESDHVRVELTDNSPEAPVSEAYAVLADEMARKKGALRRVSLPAGAGVRFHLRVPQHMIVLDGMVVRVGHVRYVLPVDSIHRILQTDRLLPVAASGGARMLHIDEGPLVPVHPLLPEPADMPAGARLYVVLSSNQTRIAIPVDELLGQQLVMLRPLQGVLSGMRDMSGIAVLSGGEVGMVVAVSALASGDESKASVAA